LYGGKEAETMKGSQIEMCIDVLGVLDHEGPLKLTIVMKEARVKRSILKDCLDFLIKQGLVKVIIVGGEKKVYAITQIGVTVLEQFRELKEVIPVIVETGNEAGNQDLCSKAQIS
jgi:predicted transcriptional regulator